MSLLLFSSIASAQAPSDLDLHSIPISDWLNAGEHADIPWDFTVRDALLRMDQRLEVAYFARIDAKNINRTGKEHELFFISRVSSMDGEWLNEPYIARFKIEEEVPKNIQTQYLMRFCVQPGEYLLWVVLYDRKTDKHNVAKRRMRVPELRGDPLPDLYRKMPLVEFPEDIDSGEGALTYVKSDLNLPVRNKRPLQVELISMLSPPEQWTGRTRVVRAHNDDTLGALTALSQMELSDGSISIAGLDLVRRQVLFEQRAFRTVKWTSLMEAMKKAQSLDISASALQGAKNNGAFFRDYLSQRLSADSAEGDPMRVIIVATSSRLFQSGSDLRPLQLESDCRCRVYYLRFRLNPYDVFDELEKLMKPLRPRTFNLITARDLRRAIADIVEELAKL